MQKPAAKFTANFERNLEDIELFLTVAIAPQAFYDLLDELLETVIPNLERFLEICRPFMARQPGSVETTNALATLRAKLSALTPDADALREYVLKDYSFHQTPLFLPPSPLTATRPARAQSLALFCEYG
ncbi:MAG: type II toxin-antitoxin system RelE/ParE family toxin [Propionivibrio sp.]|uniref:type II toxin-antitoxin system RelE/ParE family toxin n=1 Tax=Propionivibrio sp. TaxID=2212460 RepID=UPI001A62CCE5|nr:type II toxin-antitoxin system RelE/ParE family toxin [Propionivibrio sp.]MBL8413942.1 type II toxin-antitoxin system RelE/ParE family toxin [Propionivibrio sp.]